MILQPMVYMKNGISIKENLESVDWVLKRNLIACNSAIGILFGFKKWPFRPCV